MDAYVMFTDIWISCQLYKVYALFQRHSNKSTGRKMFSAAENVV